MRGKLRSKLAISMKMLKTCKRSSALAVNLQNLTVMMLQNPTTTTTAPSFKRSDNLRSLRSRFEIRASA